MEILAMDESPKRVVFADRNLEWSAPLRKRLRERGLRVEATSSAGDLLNRIRESRPDLVILGEGLGGIESRLFSGLIQERSPGTRIIRVLPTGDSAADEPGPAENVLCAVSRRSSPDDLVAVIERVLSCAPRGTLRSKPPLVVCLDDDPAFVKSLSRVLRRQGYRVLSYTEPEVALEELPLIKPDLLILDVLMPGLSGFEVLDEIRFYYSAPFPVILLSALEGDDKIAQGRRHGAACYLTKPCPPESLLDAVRRLVAASDQGPERSATAFGGRFRGTET
jgi:DNA-binding response OmpR family regulator